MAYLPQTRARDPAEARALLEDIVSRREFGILGRDAAAGRDTAAGHNAAGRDTFTIKGLRLTGAQAFIRGFQSPDTEYTRLLVNWQTGTGKSIGAIAIAQEFIRQFRQRAALGEEHPDVYVVSFQRETIQEDLLRNPEFGYVAAAEYAELSRLRLAAPADLGAARALSALSASLRRRLTDRARGGYYKFYGYKEFANRVFPLTRLGAQSGFDVSKIYGRDEEGFGERLREAVRGGYLNVNTALIRSLQGALLICDEIHNVYNMHQSNNYGVAIQYVLDALGDGAPRAVFMTATPMTGSAGEVVDILRLLLPAGGPPLRRRDFFERTQTRALSEDGDDGGDDGDGDGASASASAVSALKPGALERIEMLAAGRVSFLLDADVESYPRRTILGEPVRGLPYLKWVLCDTPPLLARTLASVEGGLGLQAYSLYDTVFPNPDGGGSVSGGEAGAGVGLYHSADTVRRLQAAAPEWREQAGVQIIAGADAGLPTGLTLVSGGWLELPRLAAYSGKYARFVEDLLGAVRAGPGKCLVYHHRVRMSGVLLLQEVLRMNGFIDEHGTAHDRTLCAACGVARADHGAAAAAHDYAPARFAVAHSEIDRTAMLRSISAFNSPANRDGHHIRVMLGSKIIREGLNFRAVRHQFILSLPTDIPTLIQVLGRAVRKGSHLELPPAEREVLVRIYAHRGAGGELSPELRRYGDKLREFVVIQEVERALRRYAVDAFINRGRIDRALGVDSRHSADSPHGDAPQARFEGLPYSPPRLDPPRGVSSQVVTYYGYQHGTRVAASAAAAIRAMLLAEPVWNRSDLVTQLRAGAVEGLAENPETFDDQTVALALQLLAQPADGRVALRLGELVVYAFHDQDGATIDVDFYMRESGGPGRAPGKLNAVADFVPLKQFLESDLQGVVFDMALKAFEAEWLRAGPHADGIERPLALCLLELSGEFHTGLLRRLVERGKSAPTTSNDKAVIALYDSYQMLVYEGKSSSPVGYVGSSAVHLYRGQKWKSAPLSDYGIGKRHRENDVVIGFVANNPRNLDRANLKLRPPLSQMRGSAKRSAPGGRADIRTLARGAVCETRPRADLDRILKALQRKANLRFNLPPSKAGGADSGADTDAEADPVADTDAGAAAVKEYWAPFLTLASQRTADRFPSSSNMCLAIRICLLALESAARNENLKDSTRWLYLHNDTPPSIV